MKSRSIAAAAAAAVTKRDTVFGVHGVNLGGELARQCTHAGRVAGAVVLVSILVVAAMLVAAVVVAQ